MAQVVVTVKIMPDSPDIDLAELEEKSRKIVADADGEVGKATTEPVAFGLKALNIVFVRDESLGSVDDIAEKISEIEGVASAEVSDVRRAIG